MVEAHLRLTIDAGNESKARIVLGRFRKVVETDITSLKANHKGGFEACMKVPVPPGIWSEQVVFVVALAQAFGRAWVLCGDVQSEIDLTTSEIGISGLEFASLNFERS